MRGGASSVSCSAHTCGGIVFLARRKVLLSPLPPPASLTRPPFPSLPLTHAHTASSFPLLIFFCLLSFFPYSSCFSFLYSFFISSPFIIFSSSLSFSYAAFCFPSTRPPYICPLFFFPLPSFLIHHVFFFHSLFIILSSLFPHCLFSPLPLSAVILFSSVMSLRRTVVFIYFSSLCCFCLDSSFSYFPHIYIYFIFLSVFLHPLCLLRYFPLPVTPFPLSYLFPSLSSFFPLIFLFHYFFTFIIIPSYSLLRLTFIFFSRLHSPTPRFGVV